jgi:hypothetical protein
VGRAVTAGPRGRQRHGIWRLGLDGIGGDDDAWIDHGIVMILARPRNRLRNEPTSS